MSASDNSEPEFGSLPSDDHSFVSDAAVLALPLPFHLAAADVVQWVWISRQEPLGVGRGRDDLFAAGLRDLIRVVVLIALVGVDGGARVGDVNRFGFGYSAEPLKSVFLDLLQEKNNSIQEGLLH